jgi:hypothetical protein
MIHGEYEHHTIHPKNRMNDNHHEYVVMLYNNNAANCLDRYVQSQSVPSAK